MLPVAEREEVGSVLVRRGVDMCARALQTFHTRRRVPRTHVSWPSSWASRAGTAFVASQFDFHHEYLKSTDDITLLYWVDRGGNYPKE